MSDNVDRESTFREALFSGGMDLDGMDVLMDLYRELYPMRKAGFEVDLKSPSDDEVSMRLGEGFTLLETRGLLSADLDLSPAVRDAADILASHSEDPDSVRKIIEMLDKEPSGFSELVDVYLDGGEKELREAVLSRERVNPEIVAFAVFNVLKGIFLSAGKRYISVRTEQWNRGRCPVCGGEPAVSFMAGEGGKRFLICHRCETNWRFRRLACPFCEHDSPEESGFLYIEEPEYKSITGYVCDRCKCYIKTWRVEEEEPGDLHPEVEDLKTPGFDAAMESEGYRRGAPNIFGILVGDVVSKGDSNPRRE